MKRFKDYLLESKQTYEFKIKLAGDYDSANTIKEALTSFDVCSVSECKRTPIQETQVDFPHHKNIQVSIFDVTLNYPATSLQIKNLVAEALNISDGCIKVRNKKELEEEELNQQYSQDKKSGESLLNKPYDIIDNQSTVGEKRTMDLLKELGKTKKQGTQYEGVNDSILAKSSPSTKPEPMPTADKAISPVGSKQNKIPNPNKGK